MKLLSPRIHAIFDYAYGIFLLIAPTVFGFGEPASSIAIAFGLGQLVLTLLTHHPIGILRAVPFPIHGGMEFVIAVAMIVMPWVGDFTLDTAARTVFLLSGLAMLGMWLTSDYLEEADHGLLHYDPHRHLDSSHHGSLRV